MDPKQRQKVIVLASLGLVIAGVLWFQFFRGPSMTSADTGASAPVVLDPALTLTNSKSVFQEVDFNIEELVQSIKEVTFDYMEVRLARDPMAPLLIGAHFRPGQPGTSISRPGSSYETLVYEVNRKVVTGIIWDESNPIAVIREPGQLSETIVYPGKNLGTGIVIKAVERDRVVFSISLGGEHMEIIKELAKEQ